MHIYILGPTRVVTPNGVMGASDFGGAKPRQILEILAISAGTPVSKDLLADRLWDGRPPKGHLGTLESYVCVLRRCLGLGGGRGASVLTVPHGYLLDPETHPVDLFTFRSLGRRSHIRGPDPEATLARLEGALELVHGDLLADETCASWAIEERARFQSELVDMASAAASQALSLGRAAAACQWAQVALTYDPLAEHAWRMLMRAMHASGRRSEGLRAFFEVRDLLAAELGTDPSPETTSLYLDLLREAPTPGTTDGGARDEIRLLMRLLRQVMSSAPGIQMSPRDYALMDAAAMHVAS